MAGQGYNNFTRSEASASPRRPRIGLALGSGAAKGWAHLGVIEVLARAGIPVDVVAGTSAGALVGAALALGRLQALHERVLQLTMREVYATVRLHFSRGGIVSGDGIMAELQRLGIRGDFSDTILPFAAVATDLLQGAEAWLREGDISSAIHASMAIPGIIAPVRRNGRWLLDGGLVNPVPVSLARAMGADMIIAVALDQDISLRHRLPAATSDPLETMADYLPRFLAHPLRRVLPDITRREQAPGYVDVVTGALDIMEAQITRARLAGEPPHVLIRPLLPHIGSFDFDRGEEVIAAGREAAEMALPHIERLLERIATALEE